MGARNDLVRPAIDPDIAVRRELTRHRAFATFLLMFALPGFMLGHSTITLHTAFEVASWMIGIPGLVLSYYTGLAYIPTIKASLRSGRARRG